MDIVGKLETYRVEKLTFKNLTTAGGESQAIKTKPVDNHTDGQRNLYNHPAAASSPAQWVQHIASNFNSTKRTDQEKAIQLNQ